MPVKIITIHYDPARGMFDDEIISKFIINKKVIRMTPHFFIMNERPHWSVFIEYEVDIVEKVKESERLDQPQRLLLQKLHEWRKEKSDQSNVPPFIISTNQELLEIVKQKPSTLESLKMIRGFGNKKVSKYGSEIIGIIKAFFDKKPVRNDNKSTNESKK